VANYNGDGNYDPSAGSTTHSVVKRTTTTVLGLSPSVAVFGEPVTLTATVSAGVGTPTGTVTFVNTTTSTTVGTVALAGGVATLITNSISAGSATLVATYNGSNDFFTSTDSASLVVNQGTTTTTLANTPDPSVLGQPVTFTATVTPVAPSTLPPSGSVTFVDTTLATTLGTVTLNAAGVATLATSALALGIHNVSATFISGGGYASSQDTDTHTVNSAGSATTVTSSATAAVFGQPVTFTATVSAVPSVAVPTGSVVFVDTTTSTTLGTVPLDGSGIATVTVSSLALGTHSISVTYTPNSVNFLGSTDTLTQTVSPAVTTTALTASPNPATAGANVVLTATVDSGVSTAVPTGSVTFVDSTTGTTLGTTAAAVGGVSITTALTAGSHTVVATYTPTSANFLASTGTLVLQVDVAPVATTTSTTTAAVSSPLPVTGEKSSRTMSLAVLLAFAGSVLTGLAGLRRTAQYRRLARRRR
jgi:hypothetical protein